ncbi:hypothetical protein VNO77_03267 [Canavalia gladiata]|uniref:Uncharacterized protein n=1 Tax=Canavalia gladiata TaxID=3824 RepID=A0AAN9R7Z6_CANGL
MNPKCDQAVRTCLYNINHGFANDEDWNKNRDAGLLHSKVKILIQVLWTKRVSSLKLCKERLILATSPSAFSRLHVVCFIVQELHEFHFLSVTLLWSLLYHRKLRMDEILVMQSGFIIRILGYATLMISFADPASKNKIKMQKPGEQTLRLNLARNSWLRFSHISLLHFCHDRTTVFMKVRVGNRFCGALEAYIIRSRVLPLLLIEAQYRRINGFFLCSFLVPLRVYVLNLGLFSPVFSPTN